MRRRTYPLALACSAVCALLTMPFYNAVTASYHAPLTRAVEDVLNVIEAERPEGVIVQFGGQTPLKIAMDLDRALKANPIPAASGERSTQHALLCSTHHRRVPVTSPLSKGVACAHCSFSFSLTKLNHYACTLFLAPSNPQATATCASGAPRPSRSTLRRTVTAGWSCSPSCRSASRRAAARGK